MATMWRKGMHFLGLGPDEDYDQEEGAHDDFLDLRDPPVEEGPAAVRPLSRERGSASVATMPRPARAVVRTLPSSAAAPPPAASVKPHSLSPTSFNDAQEVGDHFKVGTPVILNLQGVEKDLHRRMVDFASGLCYGLDGDMERVGLHIYLLTPANARVSEEERRSLEVSRA